MGSQRSKPVDDDNRVGTIHNGALGCCVLSIIAGPRSKLPKKIVQRNFRTLAIRLGAIDYRRISTTTRKADTPRCTWTKAALHEHTNAHAIKVDYDYLKNFGA